MAGNEGLWMLSKVFTLVGEYTTIRICKEFSGRRITAITLASQARDVGSTPIARSS